MSDSCDIGVERNIDSNPSTAILSTSQPFRSKSSDNNKNQHQQINSTVKTLQTNPTVLQNRQSNNVSKAGTQASDLTTQCEGLTIHDDTHQAAGNGKNAKKKELQKQLKIMTTNNPVFTTPPPQAPSVHTGLNISLNEFFSKQVSPMYAATNSRYLENLCHHPQFQLTHNIFHSEPNRENINITQHAASVPNTPLLPPERPRTISTPSSPAVQSELTTPRYLQNAMQHPLLSKTFYTRSEYFAHLPVLKCLQTKTTNNVCVNKVKDVKEQNKSPKKKKNQKKDTEAGDRLFDPYLSVEEVECGLLNNTLYEGALRINPKQFTHSYVSSSDRSEQDILIDGIKNRNRAMEGDVVVVQLLDSDAEDNGEQNKQKKGKIVHIKQKVHNRTCIGNMKLMPDKNRQKAIFMPRDHRIPRLNILFPNWPDNFYNNSECYKDTLFLAEILEWTDTRFALGKILHNIGQSGDMVAETVAILAQTNLNVTPFGPEVRHLFPRLNYKIPNEEILLREDCRKLCLFSIDPYNCRDIDDAISLKELENGNYEYGVHIADVAHFLDEETILDQKVADRATTIYLVEQAYHMLPDELCLLCSLFPGIDKLAFSIFWEINKDGIVLNHRFAKTVINSCCQLAYEHAQAVLDGNTEINFPVIHNGFQVSDIQKAIKVIGKTAAIFRKMRFDNGALRIEQPKVSFSLNPKNGMPESFHVSENKESNQMIEEFMLLANMTVAKRIQEDHPKLAFLRCHPPPSGFMLRQLAKSLKPMNIHLDISSAGDLHHSLLPHVGPTCADRGKVMVLNMLCAKPMARAKYFCADGLDDDDFHHYALNVPLYTHFTSPIRRYADIMVHRLLAASLNYRDMPQWNVDKVRMVAANCNKQKYNAKKAGELSTELYTLKYIENYSPVVTDAAVVDVKEKYIDVIVIAMGFNRRIYFNSDFPGTFLCIKNDDCPRLSKMEVTWKPRNGLPEQKQIIEVFSILRVELLKGSEEVLKIETKLVRPKLNAI